MYCAAPAQLGRLSQSQQLLYSCVSQYTVTLVTAALQFEQLLQITEKSLELKPQVNIMHCICIVDISMDENRMILLK